METSLSLEANARKHPSERGMKNGVIRKAQMQEWIHNAKISSKERSKKVNFRGQGQPSLMVKLLLTRFDLFLIYF